MKDRKKRGRKRVDEERRGEGRGEFSGFKWSMHCPRPKDTHSENRMSCSLLLRMTLPHTERIFTKTL